MAAPVDHTTLSGSELTHMMGTWDAEKWLDSGFFWFDIEHKGVDMAAVYDASRLTYSDGTPPLKFSDARNQWWALVDAAMSWDPELFDEPDWVHKFVPVYVEEGSELKHKRDLVVTYPLNADKNLKANIVERLKTITTQPFFTLSINNKDDWPALNYEKEGQQGVVHFVEEELSQIVLLDPVDLYTSGDDEP